MSLKDISPEEIMNLSMLELASMILKEEKKALDFHEIFNRAAELKGFTDQQKEDYIAQFYTDLNVDGRFTTLGANMWGLKRWYPIEQADEEVHTPKKKKATKKKRKEDLDEEFEDDLLEDDLDVLGEDLDDLDEEEDIEVIDEDDDEDLEKDDELEDLEKDLEEFEDFDEEEEEIDEEFEDDEFDDEKEEEDK